MIFKEELTWIKNERAKELALDVIITIEKKMYGPSSKSGNYHPPDENGDDGLIRHCRRVCWWVVEFCRENKFSYDIRDSMLIAAFMHDYARNLGSYQNHGLLSWKFVGRTVKYEEYEDIRGIVNKVKRYSSTHMNHWDHKAPQPKTIQDFTFAMCDYAASREQIKTPFLGVNVNGD